MSAVRPYLPKTPLTWWLRRPSYVRYMLRELTCIPIGAYVAALIVGLYRLKQGPAAWEAWRQAFASAPGVALQIIALAFTLYHAVTWFDLAPSSMPVWRRGTQIPGRWIRAAHYLAWIIVSIIVLSFAGI